jgi:DNA-binding NarL/FixJ family response regulator
MHDRRNHGIDGIKAPHNNRESRTDETEAIAEPPPEVKTVPSEDGSKIRILLVDDHPILRKGLAKLLQEHPDLSVVGEADDGLEAVDLAEKLMPDVVIMDLGLPEISGFEATRQISAKCPSVWVIGLSAYESHEFADALRKVGAAACLSKTEPPERLIQAIRACRKSAAMRKTGT